MEKMNYDTIGVVILAAGKGTRMKSDIAKVLHKVAGKSMVVRVVETALKVVQDNVQVVVGHQGQRVKQEVGQFFDVGFSIQEQLLGTGDAVKAAIPNLKPGTTDVLVLSGDVPLIQEKTLRMLLDGHNKSQAKLTVLATHIADPKGYGRIILDNSNHLLSIREEADASEAEKKIKLVNSGVYCFDKALLTAFIDQIKPDNNQKEYYLTDIIEIAKNNHEKIAVIVVDDPKQVMGVNTLEELSLADRLIQQLVQ